MTISTSALPDDFHLFSIAGIASSVGVFIALATSYALFTAIYNTFFHPLKHIPGPLSARISGIPYAVSMRNGTVATYIREAHEKYGEAVRVAPNEVSFISGETAWQDIYGFRIGKHKNIANYDKDRTWYPVPVNGVKSIIPAYDADHSRMRRNLSHAFSDKALRAQEALIQNYIDLLIIRLGEQAALNKPADIMRWYNCTTFDVIADLALGDKLHCLRDSNYHAWVDLVFASVKGAGFSAMQRKYPIVAYFDQIRRFINGAPDMVQVRKEFFALAHEKVSQRLERGIEEVPDFFNFIIKNQEKEAQALSRGEMDSNAVTFLLAGSETTATTLSGVTFLLLKNPAVYARLVKEIRTTFTSSSDITIEAANALPYMLACLHESLRCYPPVPTGFPRVVPPGGDSISGHYIPGGTAVYVSQHAANHSERNFKNPDAFVPERWLDEGKETYADDKKDAWNAFSFGPRNCIGKNLANAEMRVILAKVLYNFDLELVDTEDNWMDEQKVFTLWEKGALMVKITEVQR